jgi:flagellar biosynthetic protein FlhB
MEETLYFVFDIQLFADGDTGEKTETATPRRREDARKKGQVFKSTDLNSAIILLVGSMMVYICLPMIYQRISHFMEYCFMERTLMEINNATAYDFIFEVIIQIAQMIWPILLGAFAGALLISYLQVGAVFATEPLTPKFSKINPVEGFKRLFSKRALVELVKSFIKIGITGYVVYTVLRGNYQLFPRMVDMELNTTLTFLGSIIFEIALKVGLIFIIVGVLDYIYQWYEHEVSLKMSKYEVKQEYKQNEGDPLIRSRQRRIQREMAMRRMMAEVPKADVIITNPTHYAIAVQYKAEIMSAPVVIAKGQDQVALRIKEIAEKHKITVVENPSLARTIYAMCKIGDLIPEDLYQAVAEILAFVYKQRKVVV